MYIPFCNLNDLFFYQSARHPIYIFNFIYYFPFVFIISSMFLGLGFLFVWGGLFLFAQALCEVKEMLTQTWYFPTCSLSPSSPPPLLCFFFSFFRQQFFLGFFWAGMQRVGGGDGSFPFAAFVQMPGLFAIQLKKCFTCWLL